MVVKFYDNSGITDLGIGVLVTLYCSRVYVFLKNDNCVKTFGLFEIEDNLYSPFDDIDKKISMFCVDKGII